MDYELLQFILSVVKQKLLPDLFYYRICDTFNFYCVYYITVTYVYELFWFCDVELTDVDWLLDVFDI